MIYFQSECQGCTTLENADRKTTYLNKDSLSDHNIGKGWYRFQGPAGTKMPTSCVPINRCNTKLPGWLNGNHPAVPDGKVDRTVCFHWGINCCFWSKTIQVRNCIGFYVYYFSGFPISNGASRYCGAD